MSPEGAGLHLALRVCPGNSGGITKLSEHEADRGEAQESECLAVEVLPVLGQPSTAVQPSNGSLDDPTAWKHHKTLGLIGTPDDFNFESRQDVGEGFLERRSLIATICKEFFQEWIHAEQRRQKQDTAVAILDIGRMDDGVEQQTQRVYQNMAFLALDLLARIIAMRIDAGPPFSALFTLWLSMMAAVGLASRSPLSRHST
jgi:hypothetical protein